MAELYWRVDPAGTSVAASLLGRIDTVSQSVDEGKYVKAIERLSGRRWLEGLDLTGVPEAPLKRAQQWIDAAQDALRSPPVDVHLVQRLLLEARRALAK